MIKRIVSILLALVMFATLLPAGLIGTAEAAESTGAEAGVSRIEWVQQLVETFNMTVEEDNYPDNYYSDMDESSSGYRDLLVAVEFGVIDLEAGSAFEPEQPATREFAAHTLNYCLGFQLDNSTYTYADTADVTYADDVQVAVNRGWLTLVNGRFLPQRALTAAEATAMLADAAQVLKGLVVSESYNNTYTFKTDVIEIPNGTDVLVDESTVRITNCPKTLTNGRIFVVYVNDIPVPYIATAVAVKGNVTVVTATRAEDADAFEVFDAQGVVDADLTQVEALDGTELSYYVEELDQEFQTYAMARDAVARIGGTKAYKYALSLKKNISLGDNVSLVLDIKAKNLKVSYNINLRQGSAYVDLSFDVTTTYKIKGNFLPATCISDINDIELFYWGIPGVGGFSITYDVKLAGEISGVHESYVSIAIQASAKNGISFPREFKTKSFSISVEATMQIGFVARLGITELPAVSGYVYASFGIAARLKGTSYKDDRSPKTCIHFAAYLYGKCGIVARVSFPAFQYKESFDRDYEIFNERNSPLRIVHHYEDDVLVPSCTRSGEFEGNLGSWRTPGTSRYTSSGWSYGFGSKAYDRSGNPVTLYTYTLDDDDNATITAYKGNATAVVIPSKLDGYTVVAIGFGAFRGNNNLRAVTIPDTVTSIGNYAFYACKKLSEVTLSSTLTSLGSKAFGDCTGLTSIVIPKTVQSAGASGPFNGCSALTNVTLEKGMVVVAANLFQNCSGLVSIKIPNTVTSINDDAFDGCVSLKNVEIPDSVTAINFAAFRGCTSLEKIVIPDSVTSIGNYAFYACKKLSEVTLSSTLTSLGSKAFGDCTGLTSIVIPKTVQSAGASGPFNGCSALTNVTLEKGMVVVAANLFQNCSGLVSIKIPNTVTSINDDAFDGCVSLKNVEIPDSVTAINFAAFRGCTSLEKIVIPDSVTGIGNYAFYGCKKLSDVKLPNTRQNIVRSMFQDCTSLKTITLPDTVMTIQSYAFSGCTALERIVFPDSLTSIQGSAFLDCSSLKNVTWSKNLTSIDSSAFSNCSALETLELPISVTNLGYGAFSNCDGLTTIIIPDSVTKLGTKVFYDCDALTSVKLGSGITAIPASTFEHCDVLESIVIPRRVTTIGNSAFKDCVKFTSITIPRSVTSIGSTAFSYPAKMTIYGVSGTYAETYANDNGIKFVDKQVGATDITLDPARLTINKGASAMLTLTIKPEDFTDTVSWKSSDTSVVTVSDTGVVKGVGLGTATIKVVVGSKSASCTVIVQQPVTSISLNSSSRTMDALETFQLTATANPSTAVDRRVSWSSSDPAIASVDANGLVTAYKKGSAVITVSAMDGSGVTATCKITVANNGYVCTSPTQMESPHNYPNNCGDAWIYTAAGATSLKVTFDKRTNMESGFDYLYIYNAAGEQVGKYTGTSLAGKTITVTGPSVKIKLVSDDSGNEWGFKVTGITVTSSAAPTAPVVRISNSAASGKPMLTWNAVEGATSYRIYRSTSKGSGYSLLGTTTATSYTNTGAKAGTTYYYRVKAVNDAGMSPYSNVVSGKVKSVTPKPSAPVVKIGNSASSGKPMLTWNAVSGATSYKVYRATAKNGAYSLLGTVTATSYTNTGAKAGVTYYYKVKAVNSAGESAYSNVVSGRATVTTLTMGHSASSGKPQLTWKAVSGAASYRVYRATAKNGAYSVINTTKALTYTNVGAALGTTYYYKVEALNASGKSMGFSAVVEGKVAPVLAVGYSGVSGKPQLTWKAVPGATEYQVYRSTQQNSGYTKINTTTSTSYVNTGAKAGTTYYYKIVAVKGTAASDFSNIVSARPSK